MGHVGLTLDGAPERDDGPSADGATGPGRLRGMVDAYYAFIWRSLRRLGVPQADVDDAVQHVFLTASRKLASIRPESEKSFLFQTAVRVASDARRTIRRRREVLDEPPGETPSSAPDAEAIAAMRQARATLDMILEGMSIDLRVVFVLYELDEMPTAEIAALLDVPVGTASSRLRRARAEFSARVAELQRTTSTPVGGTR
jgi:RNA polymerase sigma-70 factor (ECF subfamily)